MVYVRLLMYIRSVSVYKEFYAWDEVLLGIIMFPLNDLLASTWKLPLLLKTMIPSIVQNEASPTTLNIVIITGEVWKELYQSHAVYLLDMWSIDMSYMYINGQTMTHQRAWIPVSSVTHSHTC